MIKCNTCMQLLEPENVEMYVMSHHFSEIEKQTISKKKSTHNYSSIKKHVRIVSNKVTSIQIINYSPKIKFFNHYSSKKKLIKMQESVKLVCNTCKKEMNSEICRILITRNKDNCPQFFSFHFFSPCWNFENFCQKYPNLILDRTVFSISKNMSISENGIKDLQNNLSFWD